MLIRFMMVMEFSDASNEREAQEHLDRFREAVTPASYGLCLYRATCEDVRESGCVHQAGLSGPPPSAFVKPWVETD